MVKIIIPSYGIYIKPAQQCMIIYNAQDIPILCRQLVASDILMVNGFIRYGIWDTTTPRLFVEIVLRVGRIAVSWISGVLEVELKLFDWCGRSNTLQNWFEAFEM